MDIEKHYEENILRLRKMLTFSTGSIHDAEDIIHNAYERAIRYYKASSVMDEDRWFGGILRSCFRDFLREKNNRPDSEPVDEYEHVGEDCQGELNQFKKEIIKLVMETDNPRHREVLLLYHKHGLSILDISLCTPYTRSAVRLIVWRFRETLKKLYEA